MKLSVAGGVTLGPATPSCGAGGGGDCVSVLNACQYPQASIESARQIASPVTWIDLLANTGIALCTFVFISVSGGTVELRVSSEFGDDQIVPISGLFLLSNAIAGSELTTVEIRGTATIQVTLAGN